MSAEQIRADLLPCPFCGAGKTEVRENGRPWLGMKWGEPDSVSVRHWCEPVVGQPSRMIERVGRDRAAAIAAWNTRADLQSQDREDAQRFRKIMSMTRAEREEVLFFVCNRDVLNAIDQARRAEENGE